MAPFERRWSSARKLAAAYRAKRTEGGLRGLLGAPFTPKPWQNFPATTTPITAEALIDLETRLATYTELEDKAEAERAEKAEGERLKVAANLSDLTSASTARTNLGLGSAATQASSAFDASGAATAAQAAAIAASVPLASKGAALGVAPLDASALIPSAFLPPLALTEPFVVHSEAEQLAISNAHLGDFAIRTDIGKTFVHNTGTSGTMADWTELITPGDVTSVNGHVGTVALTSADVGAIPTTAEGAASGVATLTAGSIGAQPPAHHAATHAEGGTDPLTTADLPASVGIGRATDGSFGLLAPTNVGLELVITAGELEEINFNGVSL